MAICYDRDMKSSTVPPTLMVIVGITGDLARRKLLPAIVKIAAAGQLPRDFLLVGISRRNVRPDEVLEGIDDPEGFLAAHLRMFRMGLERREDYDRLKDFLATSAAGFPQPAQCLFYLSVPPQISEPIITFLGECGIAEQPGTKLLLEKPFGTDLISARELIEATHRHFKEDQVYRIDHYLAKEMAQNILVFRSGNSLFKQTWNKDFIEKIEILASEAIGIEGRSIFYEQTGALRDVVQSHLLQLAALTLMELPADEQTVAASRLRALRLLSPPPPDASRHLVRRGQYEGYREEAEAPHSTIETFVSLTLFSIDPNWQGVPIRLITGKALDKKVTEIRVHYRREDAGESNQLVLRIQPHEGIEVALWSKRPGYTRRLEQVRLDFTYTEHYDQLPEAYEQVMLDAICSDRNLFASSEEILASWEILAPIQHAWSMDDSDLLWYTPGSRPEDI